MTASGLSPPPYPRRTNQNLTLKDDCFVHSCYPQHLVTQTDNCPCHLILDSEWRDLTGFIVLASQVQPSWTPTATPGLAWSLLESGGLTEELGVRVQLSLPWAHTTLKQSVLLVEPSVRSFRQRIHGPPDREGDLPQPHPSLLLSPTCPEQSFPRKL